MIPELRSSIVKLIATTPLINEVIAVKSQWGTITISSAGLVANMYGTR